MKFFDSINGYSTLSSATADIEEKNLSIVNCREWVIDAE